VSVVVLIHISFVALGRMKRGYDSTNKEEATSGKKKKGGSHKNVAAVAQSAHAVQNGEEIVAPSQSSDQKSSSFVGSDRVNGTVPSAVLHALPVS